MKYAVLGSLVLGSVSWAYAQCDDPFDATLCLYKLTEQQAQQFNGSDRQVSAFWAGLTGDYVELTPPNNCAAGACSFSGADDGTLLVKVAGTAKGIYVYAEVQDNVWVDRVGNNYGDDSVDMYFDTNDAATLASCTDCLIGLYQSALSYGTQQFQVFMGSTSLPTTFQFSYYDPNAWSWQTLTGISFADAKTLHNLEIDIIGVDATHKAQEWFVPWPNFGAGVAVGTDLSGKRFGFAGGYNDMDGDNAEPDKLRWPQDGDPWADMSVKSYWGDILVPSDMGAVEGVAVRKPVARTAVPAMSAHAETFTLRGERLSSGANTAVVVRRSAGMAAKVAVTVR